MYGFLSWGEMVDRFNTTSSIVRAKVVCGFLIRDVSDCSLVFQLLFCLCQVAFSTCDVALNHELSGRVSKIVHRDEK